MLTKLKSFRNTYDLGWIDAVLMTLLVYAFVVSVFGAALNVLIAPYLIGTLILGYS